MNIATRSCISILLIYGIFFPAMTMGQSIPPELKIEPRTIPDTFFGTTSHVNSPTELALLKDLQVPCLRIDFAHNVMEPTQGQYAFGANNPPHSWIIDSADLGIKEGFDQLAVVTTGAPWMSYPNGTYPREEYLKSFEDFMYAIATKYKGKIRYWEASNEPNMVAESRETYVPMLKAFYKGVKRADPENKVVMAGFAGNEPAQMEVAYQQGAKDYFDILNSHSYTRPQSPEDGGYLFKLAELQKVMQKYGDNKPLWVTEIGWCGLEASTLEYMKNKYESHRNNSCTAEEQARYYARTYLMSAMYPWIERVYFFQLNNIAPSMSEQESCDAYIGLVESWAGGIAPRQSYFSVKTVIQMLRGSTFVGRIDMGERIWALKFERKDDAFIALWSLNDNVTLTLKNALMIKGITSMVGTPVLLRNNTLQLSGSPIYLQVDKNQLQTLADQIQQAVLTGSPVLSLSIAMDMQASLPEQPVINTIIRNVGKEAMEIPALNVSVAAPYSANLADDKLGVLQPGQEKIVPLPVKVNITQGSRKQLTATATLGDNVVKATKEVDYFVIPKWTGPAPDKATWSDWPEQGQLHLEARPQSISGNNWKSQSDCSANIRLAWTPDALYLAAEVQDNALYQTQPPVEIWRDDSLQIAFDSAGDAKPSSNVRQYDGMNDVEFGLAWGKDAPASFAWAMPGNESKPLQPTRLSVTRDEGRQITCYLLVIPWSQLGITTPKAGQWMGMDIVVNDSDAKDQRGWIEWTGGIGSVKDPSKFAKIVLGM